MTFGKILFQVYFCTVHFPHQRNIKDYILESVVLYRSAWMLYMSIINQEGLFSVNRIDNTDRMLRTHLFDLRHQKLIIFSYIRSYASCKHSIGSIVLGCHGSPE